MRRFRYASLLTSLSLAVAAACGSSDGSTFDPYGTSGGPEGGASSSSGGRFDPGDGGGNGDGSDPFGQPIEITPADVSFTIDVGGQPPTQTFTAKVKGTDEVVPASWAIDRGEIGAIGLQTGVFTASGNFGGKAKITATYRGQIAQTTVSITLKAFQNGSTEPPPGPDAGTGAGGLGGVGGDGPGGNIGDEMVAVLHGTPVQDPGLTALYPYDGTVWPRGILPPLLMWKPGAAGHYKAVSIKLTEKYFEYEGVFASNSTTDDFKNYQIPQQAWKQLLSSNEGEDVDVTITLATTTKAYGPLRMKWKVASAPLKGIVYYNSYGTNLAKNHEGALTAETAGAPKVKFGGATLGVHGGSTDPVLVAGADGDDEQCRVCHSVAANGSVLITQRNVAEHRKFSTYDLKQSYPNGEIPMAPEGNSDAGVSLAPYAWSAIYPDGTMFLNDATGAAGSTCQKQTCDDGEPGNMLWNTVNLSGTGPQTPTPVTTKGWPSGLRAAYPAFSPDGKGLAFTMYAGAAGDGAADRRTLGFMTFDRTAGQWGPMKALFTPSSTEHSALYPAFLPTNDAVVFEVETEYNGHDYGGTRSRRDTNGHEENDFSKPLKDELVYDRDHGAHGELWWVRTNVDGTPIAVRLDRLNGKDYVPLGPAGSEHDTRAKEETLNYEPTVNPVPSGGYAWVVFTSRRLYGNVATQNPFWSDPRYHDLTKEPTTKKLWVAAIDLNAPPDKDPSHPAFYLPAQELLAGNSRGYWVVDPCKTDGNGCESGDECCGGYCRPNAENKLVCSNVVPTCAQEYETCKSQADCCNAADYQCINGRCALKGPVK